MTKDASHHHCKAESNSTFPKGQETKPKDRFNLLMPLETFASYTTPQMKKLLFCGKEGFTGRPVAHSVP